MGAASIEPPLIAHLREIADGTRAAPSADERRHHYVPDFQLARWAKPQQPDGVLAELLLESGKVRPTTPDASAFERHRYPADVGSASPNLAVEAHLSVIEEYAAEPFERLASLPSSISDEDRATLALLIAYQQARTPPGLAMHKLTVHSAAHMSLMDEIDDPVAFADIYRDKVDAEATDADIDAARASALQNKAIRVPSAAVFESIIKVAPATAATIAAQDWTLLTPESGEFVINDRAIAMFDPTLDFPWRGNAWESSREAQAMVPIAPNACLLMTPGTGGFSTRAATPFEVIETNLRTYGWAEQSIFGTTETAVERVRLVALSRDDLVAKPRPPAQIHVYPIDPSDESAGMEHAERGWPRMIAVPRGDGSTEHFGYDLIDIEPDSGPITPVRGEIKRALRQAFLDL